MPSSDSHAADIELIALTEALLPLLNTWRTDPAYGGEFDWFGPKTLLGPADLDSRYLISWNGQFVGDMQHHEVQYGPNAESTASNMGIALLPEFRGQGIGTTAQKILSDQLLMSYQRVEASTDVENIAEQRSLEKAGFIREGVLRSAQFRDGQYHDLVSYSRVRSGA